MKSLMVRTISAYQLWACARGHDICRFTPSCSQYAIDAFREFGLIRGVALARWRLLRCHPWSHGGVDHARDQTLFRRPSGERHA